VGESLTFELGSNSPAFTFETGKSYFRAFALPETTQNLEVTVDSYLVGGDLKYAYLFAPRIITLDKNYNMIRTSNLESFTVERAGLVEALQRAEGLEQKLSGNIIFDENNRSERFLILHTTDTLLKERTSVPVSGENSILTIGVANMAKEMFLIPHAPAGKITLTLKPLRDSVIASTIPAKTEKAEAQPVQQIVPLQNQAAKTALTPDRPPQIITGTGSSAFRPVMPLPTNPLIVTTRNMNGVEIGQLELGKTNVSSARQLFSNFGLTIGTERKNVPTIQIGTIQVKPKYLYLPTSTPHQLFFDENDKLVMFIDSSPTGIPGSSKDFLQQFTGTWESGRTLKSFDLQTSLSRCVTLIASFNTFDDSLASATFAYTCTTK
jgi:hypothetical protein